MSNKFLTTKLYGFFVVVWFLHEYTHTHMHTHTFTCGGQRATFRSFVYAFVFVFFPLLAFFLLFSELHSPPSLAHKILGNPPVSSPHLNMSVQITEVCQCTICWFLFVSPWVPGNEFKSVKLACKHLSAQSDCCSSPWNSKTDPSDIAWNYLWILSSCLPLSNTGVIGVCTMPELFDVIVLFKDTGVEVRYFNTR